MAEKVKRVPGHRRAAMVAADVRRDGEWSIYRYDSGPRAVGGAVLLGLGLVVTFSAIMWLLLLFLTIGIPVLMGVIGFFVGLAIIYAGGRVLDGKV